MIERFRENPSSQLGQPKKHLSLAYLRFLLTIALWAWRKNLAISSLVNWGLVSIEFFRFGSKSNIVMGVGLNDCNDFCFLVGGLLMSSSFIFWSEQIPYRSEIRYVDFTSYEVLTSYWIVKTMFRLRLSGSDGILRPLQLVGGLKYEWKISWRLLRSGKSPSSP